ncbi:hypothetical protein NPIL_381101, partial [Nephila pilipes]
MRRRRKVGREGRKGRCFPARTRGTEVEGRG